MIPCLTMTGNTTKSLLIQDTYLYQHVGWPTVGQHNNQKPRESQYVFSISHYSP